MCYTIANLMTTTNLNAERVKGLYALLGARWYDFFKRIWNKLVGTEAEKELESFLKAAVQPAASILELGCGTALNLEKIFSLDLPFKRYLGLDVSSDMLKIARAKFAHQPNVEFREQDIMALDGRGDKFDVILCTWVLSHLPSPSTLVNRAQELLSPGGRFFLIFFSTPEWHVRFWLAPIAKYLFRSKFVSADEIKRLNNVQVLHRHAAGVTTVVEITKLS